MDGTAVRHTVSKRGVGVVDRDVARQAVGHAAHMGRTLDVVLASQWVHARAGLREVPCEQREVRQARDHVGAVLVLGHSETVKGDRRLHAGVEASGAANVVRIDAAQRGHRLGSEARERRPEVIEAVDSFGDEVSIDEVLVHDHAGNCIEERDVRAGPDTEMHVRVLGELDCSRVDHDEVRASEGCLLDARTHDRMVLGGIRTAYDDGACPLDVVEGVRRRPGAEDRPECSRARRVAHPRATVDVVGSEHDPRELLGDVVVLVGRARGSEHGDARRAVLLQQALEVPRDMLDGRIPGDLLPATGVADHRAGDPVAGVHEPVRVPALHAEMALAHRRVEHGACRDDLPVVSPDLELTADAAIRAHRPRPSLHVPDLEHRPVGERAGRARVDAGPT